MVNRGTSKCFSRDPGLDDLESSDHCLSILVVVRLNLDSSLTPATKYQ